MMLLMPAPITCVFVFATSSLSSFCSIHRSAMPVLVIHQWFLSLLTFAFQSSLKHMPSKQTRSLLFYVNMCCRPSPFVCVTGSKLNGTSDLLRDSYTTLRDASIESGTFVVGTSCKQSHCGYGQKGGGDPARSVRSCDKQVNHVDIQQNATKYHEMLQSYKTKLCKML